MHRRPTVRPIRPVPGLLAALCAPLLSAALSGSAPAAVAAAKSVPAAKSAPAAKPVAAPKAAAASAKRLEPKPPARSLDKALVSPGDTILATVGNRVITTAEFRRAWDRVPAPQRPAGETPLATSKIFLEDLITRDLLAIEAMKHPRPLTPDQESELRATREALMKNELFEEDVYDKVQVDHVDLDLFKKEVSQILTLRAFAFPDAQAAHAWYTRLVGGTPVSKLEALAQSQAPGSPHVVDLPYRIRESFPDSLAGVVFTLAPGRFSRPVRVGDEWWIYQLLATRMRPYSIDLNSPDAVLREVKRFRTDEAREAYRAALGRELKIAYDTTAVDTLLNRFLVLPPRVSMDESGTGVFSAYGPLPKLAPSDSGAVLATTIQGQVRTRDVANFLAATPAVARPDIRSREQLLRWVDRVAFDRELLRRAEERGLDRAPAVAEELARRREGYQVEQLYADSVTARLEFPEDSLRAHFYADSTRYYQRATARVWGCLVDRRSLADSVLAMARSGEDPAMLATRYSTADGAAQTGGKGELIARGDNPDKNVEDLIYSTPVDSLAGPVQDAQGEWMVFRVLEKHPEVHRSFAQARPDVLTQYRSIEEDRRFRAFVKDLRGRIPVESHEERLTAVAQAKS